MNIFIVHGCETEEIKAYKTIESARNVLFEWYSDYCTYIIDDPRFVADMKTLNENGFIEDFGWIEEVSLSD